MAEWLLDLFVLLEVVVVAANFVWIARTTESQALRAILPMVAALLVIGTLIALPEIKRDGDGLYAIGLIPFSLLLLLPIAALSFTGAAWYSSRKKLQRLQKDDPGR